MKRKITIDSIDSDTNDADIEQEIAEEAELSISAPSAAFCSKSLLAPELATDILCYNMFDSLAAIEYGHQIGLKVGGVSDCRCSAVYSGAKEKEQEEAEVAELGYFPNSASSAPSC